MATAEQIAQYKKNALDTANRIGTSLDKVIASRPSTNNTGQVGSTSTSIGAPKIDPPPSGSPNVSIPNSTTTSATNNPPKVTAPMIPNLNPNQTGFINKNYGSVDNYVNSQGNRYLAATAAGDQGLVTRLQDDAKRLGYSLPPTTTTNPVVQDEINKATTSNPYDNAPDWIEDKFKEDIAKELNAYNTLLGQYGYDYSKAVSNLAGQRAVDVQGAQDLQNRRGGFYSGGLDYQLGSINSGYNQRNADLEQLYGSRISELSANIANLQANAPQELTKRLEEWAYNQANLYGVNPLTGQKTLAGQAQDDQKAINLADVRGYYLPPGAEQLINTLIGIKQQAEAPGITADRRAALSSQAQGIRNQLTQLGVDSKLFGADVSSAAAGGNIAKAGTPTVTTRQLDRAEFESDREFELAKGQQDWENNFKSEQFSWEKAQTAWENSFKEKTFEQSVKEFTEQMGYNWASLNSDEKKFFANLAFEQKTQGQNQLYDIWEITGVAPQGIPGVSPGTPYTGQQQLPQGNSPDLSDLGRYYDGIVQRDPDTNQISNPDQVENAILNDASTSSYQKYQLYNRYGLPWEGPVPSPN